MSQTLQSPTATSFVFASILIVLSAGSGALPANAGPWSGTCTHVGGEVEFFTSSGQRGICGGRVIVSQRSEPKTFNPITAADFSSQSVIRLLSADLIHINGSDFGVEPALAKSWTLSADGRTYTLALRRGLRFSDGHPFDADDVVFSFEAYLDESLNSPQRDLLLISGQPIRVRKLDPYTVAFSLPSRYGAGARIFDGIAIVPRHVLETKAKARELATAWGVNTDPKQIVGLGPFRLKEFVPGQRVVVERNPFYWKKDSVGQKLPYLDEIVSEIVPNSEAEAMRFLSGQTDVMSRMTAANFTALKPNEARRGFSLYDLGPGFEYTFLFFNLNLVPSRAGSQLTEKQQWFSQVGFRQAIANSIDRDSIVRLAYRGYACPLSTSMSPANSFWLNGSLPRPVRSLSQAREWLRKAGFSWSRNGSLQDARGKSVEFSLLVNNANPQQREIGVLIQEDLKDLGIQVTLNTLDYHSFLNRVFSSFDYDAAILTLADGDADPNTQLSFLVSRGTNHVWSLKPREIPDWQVEIDALMQKQLAARTTAERKKWFDQVQEILWRVKPVIFLTSPNILVGARNELRNFHPAKLPDYTLWNAEQLFKAGGQRTTGR